MNKTISCKNKKKHSRTIPDVQFKEFSLTKQKTRHRTDQIKKENLGQNSASEQKKP